MVFEKYGIKLHRLDVSQLERVRTWRNADHVRLNMEFQQLISEEQQRNWFDSIDNPYNFYFLISFDNQWVGVVNAKDVDYETRTAEAGIFVGNSEYLNSYVPVLGVLAMMDFVFFGLGIDELTAKMNCSIDKVVNFNRNLGYVQSDKKSNNEFAYFSVNKEMYMKKTEQLRLLARNFFGEKQQLSLLSDDVWIEEYLSLPFAGILGSLILHKEV